MKFVANANGLRPGMIKQMQRLLVRPERLRNSQTLCSEGRCSIQLSYGRIENILRHRTASNQLWQSSVREN